MTYFRWVGLLSSLLFVGAFGALLAPLPSHALSVTIDGRAVQLTTTSAACTSGYNLCAFIPPGTYGGWTVGNVSSTNRARIMIGDNSAANSLDLLKLTGITFTPVVTAGTKTMRVVVTHTYNAGGGNPAGNYAWGYGMAGYLDPPANENIVGDQLQQTGQGNFAGKMTALGSGLDTGKFATPSTNNLNGSVTKSRAAVVVMPACNTGSNRCAPTITQTFTLTVVGADKLVLSDSVIAAGGTCRAVEQVIPIPPHLYVFMRALDPHAPNDINKLSAWLTKMGEKYLKHATQKPLLKDLIKKLDKWLAATVPGSCPEILEEINAVVEDDVEAEELVFAAVGAVPAEPGPTAFTPLGFFLGGGSHNYAWDVSSDGSVVVGQGLGETFFEPARWEAGTNPVSLNPGAFGTSEAVSGDGSVVAGWGENVPGVPHAFRWTTGAGLVDLGTLPSGSTSYAKDVSADGTVVVGYSDSSPPAGIPPPPPGVPSTEAFRWTPTSGMVGLGTLPGAPILDSYAYAVSADGSVIVGTANNGVSGYELFRWTTPGPIQGLGVLHATPTAVSGDGSVIAGYTQNSGLVEAFCWSQAAGLEVLPRLPGATAPPNERANDISSDGSIIVGHVQSPAYTDIEAVIWRKTGGTWEVRTLKDVLVTDFGVTAATSWHLSTAEGISSDGRTIVGWGVNPNGNGAAWKIQLP